MKKKSRFGFQLLLLALLPGLLGGCFMDRAAVKDNAGRAALAVRSGYFAPTAQSIRLEGLFFETAKGRTYLPAEFSAIDPIPFGDRLDGEAIMPDGRIVEISVNACDSSSDIHLSAKPNNDILKWGFAVPADSSEYFTGIMERLVDGPQTETWKPGRTEALNLRGQKIEFVLKPTLSVYAPFFVSSSGYGLFVRGSWPGLFDFCASDPSAVKVEFEGRTLDFKIYQDKDPAALVSAHALDAGPPLLPPKWAFTPWRWRDEHTNLNAYYDGTPVTGPYNSQVMEDILMMKAFGIPCGVYWIDRPWGPGVQGYDDFTIDEKADPAKKAVGRLPYFESMVKWLGHDEIRTVLWIAAFLQGDMEKEGQRLKYTYPGQKPYKTNYPLVDFTNPPAKAFWQAGFAKLLRLGVAGFKLDRGEEDMPDRGDQHVHDGRTLTENRNDYVVQYVNAAWETAQKFRGNDFVLMPRAAFTGSAAKAIFWGGDIHTTQEGLRASIIGAQRAAVMGYPCWGSDTCGYAGSADRDVSGRWLGFSCFTPIMEVGPTWNRAFWDMPTQPSYDAELIAIWRLYARLHQRMVNYTYACAQIAHETGLPVVRPLFLVYPNQKEAWENWNTYLYGPDILVSPIWKTGQTEQRVYLPAGEKWRDAWNPASVIKGGQYVTVKATLHQVPLFVRASSKTDLGDLNKEYRESLAIAAKKPNLQKLDAELRARFDAEQGISEKN